MWVYLSGSRLCCLWILFRCAAFSCWHCLGNYNEENKRLMTVIRTWTLNRYSENQVRLSCCKNDSQEILTKSNIAHGRELHFFWPSITPENVRRNIVTLKQWILRWSWNLKIDYDSKDINHLNSSQHRWELLPLWHQPGQDQTPSLG